MTRRLYDLVAQGTAKKEAGGREGSLFSRRSGLVLRIKALLLGNII